MITFLVEFADELTDNETADTDGWVKKWKSFSVPNFGNACVYIHQVVVFPIGPNKWNLREAKISGVVQNVNDPSRKLHFQFFDSTEHRTAKTADKFHYVPCEDWMGELPEVHFTAKWGLFGYGLLNRRVRSELNGRWENGQVVLYIKEKELYEVEYGCEKVIQLTLDALLNDLRP